MKRMKGVALALVLILVMGMLSGCGGMSEDDAKAYVKSVLDASYKGDYKDYMEQTKCTEDKAKELHEGGVDETMSAIGLTDLGISDELTEKYRQLFLNMVEQAKYTVGDAKESGDDGFEVEVTVEPFTGLQGLNEEIQQVMNDEIANIDPSTTEDQINELVFQKLYEMIREKVANPVYGEAQKVTVHVVLDSDNTWSIPDEDLTDVDTALFPE